VSERGWALLRAELRNLPSPGQFIAGGTTWGAWTRMGTALLLLERPNEALTASGSTATAGELEPDRLLAGLRWRRTRSTAPG